MTTTGPGDAARRALPAGGRAAIRANGFDPLLAARVEEALRGDVLAVLRSLLNDPETGKRTFNAARSGLGLTADRFLDIDGNRNDAYEIIRATERAADSNAPFNEAAVARWIRESRSPTAATVGGKGLPKVLFELAGAYVDRYGRAPGYARTGSRFADVVGSYLRAWEVHRVSGTSRLALSGEAKEGMEQAQRDYLASLDEVTARRKVRDSRDSASPAPPGLAAGGLATGVSPMALGLPLHFGLVLGVAAGLVAVGVGKAVKEVSLLRLESAQDTADVMRKSLYTATPGQSARNRSR